MILKLSKNQLVRGQDLDRIIDGVNNNAKIRGTGGITVTTDPRTGTTVRGLSGLSSIAGVKRAITSEDAPASDTITANLYTSKGIEADSGTGFAVNVHCFISGGTDLNSAIPRLEEDDDLIVAKLPFDSAGTLIKRWYCLSVFQASEDCDLEGEFELITEKSAAYTATVSDDVIVVNNTSPVTIDLPNPTGAFEGKVFYIKNKNTGLATVDADTTGSSTIDGETTQTVNKDETLKVVSDGTEYWSV